MTKDEILASLPKLSKADLQAIITVAGSLIGRPTNDPTGVLGNEATLASQIGFNALAAALGQHSTLAMLPATQRQKFERNLIPLTKFLDTIFAAPRWDKNRITKLAVLQYMFNLLASELHRMKVTVSFNSMIVNMGRIPVAFDTQFPGYRAAGVSTLVLHTICGFDIHGAKASKGVPSRARVHTRKHNLDDKKV